MQEAIQVKAANDAAVDNKQDIVGSKLDLGSDKQIGVGHVDGVKSAAGRYTAATGMHGKIACLHKQNLHDYAAWSPVL